MMVRFLNQEMPPVRVQDPSWIDINTSIRGLNGKDQTLVTLELTADHHMGIGCGDGDNYVVYTTSDNLSFRSLVDPSRQGPGRLRLVCGGQEGEFDREEGVGLATVLQAAKFFCETGEPDPSLTWRSR